MKLIFNFATLDEVVMRNKQHFMNIWNICIEKDSVFHGNLSTMGVYSSDKNKGPMGETRGWKNYKLKKL